MHLRRPASNFPSRGSRHKGHIISILPELVDASFVPKGTKGDSADAVAKHDIAPTLQISVK